MSTEIYAALALSGLLLASLGLRACWARFSRATPAVANW